MFVQLKEYNDDTPKLLDNIRNELKTITGANLIVREFENGPPIDAPIGIRLVGPEIETLRELSAQVERIMLANPGTQNVDNPQRTGRSDLVKFAKAMAMRTQSVCVALRVCGVI